MILALESRVQERPQGARCGRSLLACADLKPGGHRLLYVEEIREHWKVGGWLGRILVLLLPQVLLLK